MANVAKNATLLNSLPTVKRQSYTHAYLVTEESSVSGKIENGKTVFLFLYNPENVSISMAIAYQETAIPFTSVPQQSFANGGGQSLTITDLILDTFYEGKSLQPVLDALTALREPTMIKGILRSPPVLYFKWASHKSFPCVLTQIDYTITHRINGLPAKAKLSITLKEVPQKGKQLSNVSAIQPTVAAAAVKTLTLKQLADGLKTVQNSLLSDIAFKNLPSAVQKKVKDKKYSIAIDSHSGVVNLLNNDKTVLYNYGVFNGDILSLTQLSVNKNFNLGGG